MVSRRPFRYGSIVLALSILRLGAVGQTPSGNQERNLRRKSEDQVARLFETLRAKQELPPFTRVIHRQSLEELVCSSAQLDRAVWWENTPGAVMYKTDDLMGTPDLEEIARYKDIFGSSNEPRLTRYAVAVWPLSNQASGRTVYWVGIELYMSAWWEFIDNNFTDNRSHKDDWKKLVVQPCRNVD